MTNVYTETESGRFPYIDGYDGISDVDLQILLTQCQSLLVSLVSECNKRNLKAGKITEWETTLREASERLHVRGRLDDQDFQNIEFVRELNKKEILTTQNKTYRSFVLDVIRYCNPGFALVCIISFGQRSLVKLKERGRTDLLKLIKDIEGSFLSSLLDQLAIENQIRELAGMWPNG
jgi:hypothetical protein